MTLVSSKQASKQEKAMTEEQKRKTANYAEITDYCEKVFSEFSEAEQAVLMKYYKLTAGSGLRNEDYSVGGKAILSPMYNRYYAELGNAKDSYIAPEQKEGEGDNLGVRGRRDPVRKAKPTQQAEAVQTATPDKQDLILQMLGNITQTQEKQTAMLQSHDAVIKELTGVPVKAE